MQKMTSRLQILFFIISDMLQKQLAFTLLEVFR